MENEMKREERAAIITISLIITWTIALIITYLVMGFIPSEIVHSIPITLLMFLILFR